MSFAESISANPIFTAMHLALITKPTSFGVREFIPAFFAFAAKSCRQL